MSKIGKKPIIIKDGVEIKIDKKTVFVKGPKGELSYTLLDGVNAKVNEGAIEISIESDDKKNLRGLTRTLVSNMVDGVTTGFEKKLLVMGVGYAVKKEGNALQLSLGLSHKVKFEVPSSIQSEVEQDAKGNYVIILKSIDKQHLGEVASKIRDLRKPEPYKGKGIRYFDEVVKLKAGKTAKK
ncbi:MAG: 50S ribosomal protein L6 [Candidatus Absconditabacteria bacterium]|nr:50S ribosomal protein L6 [Candidatus Absconditabacteria bacterium]